MPRGGSREGAGRPSLWKSGCKFEDTKLIRVPFEIADRVLEYARRLDAGEIDEVSTKPKKKKPESQTYPFLCPKCRENRFSKDGTRNGKQRYRCCNCRHRFDEQTAARVIELETNSNIFGSASDAESLDRVNPLPEGSERSEEG